MLGLSVLLGAIASLAVAQFPPTPEGVTVLKSKFHENVTISFKEPGICETTPGVRSFAGHIHLPPGLLSDANGEPQDYPINTFYWFFEARHDPENAPLAIWLNGGPGASSLMGLLQENGPCFIQDDSATTALNPLSWNNHVNMLYIDEPNQVGLSYDTPTNCTVLVADEGEISLKPTDFSSGLPQLNLTSRVGTFSSQNSTHTANGTAQAAHAIWHFAQTFFSEFPHYKPADEKISLWAESYGGHYGPAFMRFFQQQNEKIANGTIDEEHAHYLHLDTLGIVNGLLDALIQEEAYISFPYNNTYGIQAFNQSVYEELLHNFTAPGGCKEQLKTCQDRLRGHYDAVTIHDTRTIATDLCEFDEWCQQPSEGFYIEHTNAGWFDISHSKYDPFPPPHLLGYMLQEEVLAALGSPVNFTWYSKVVSDRFEASFDYYPGDFKDAIGYLLDQGIKVHMMYGDRDYACNWVGGEAVSLAIPYSRSKDFANAGYAPLITDEGIGGQTRQFGNYSFSRVYQAGHEVPSYQPLVAYEIFMRAMFNKDIATGLSPVADEYATRGPKDTWHIKNKPPQSPEPKCYVLEPGTCEPEVWKKVVAGNVVVKDYFVVGEIGDDEGGISDGEL